MAGEAQVLSYLHREKSFLILLGDFSSLVEDLDLHVLSLGIEHEPIVREMLVDGLTALGLHLASRPVDEHVGWTVRLRKPSLNLFFTGTSATGSVVGRAYVEGVEPREESLFFGQAKREFGETRTSSVPVKGVDVFGMVETFYQQSEQKPARFYHHEQLVAFVQALPDADPAWLSEIDAEQLYKLVQDGELEELAERRFRFRCGCDRKKIAKVLLGVYGDSPEALFAEDEHVEVECPRCAAQLQISREDYAAALSANETDRSSDDTPG